MTPFLLACSSRNAKYCASAIQCLNSMVTIGGLTPECMDDIIEALKESTHLGVEIQLKILQFLPVLVQKYGQTMVGDTVINLLEVCVILQAPNKIAVVVNTASATLQQLLVTLFERVPYCEGQGETMNKSHHQQQHTVVIDGDKQKIAISDVAYDAYMIFIDLCNLTEHQRPEYLKMTQMSETFGLELLESILTNHSNLFLARQEFAYVLRTRAVPLLLRALSEKRDFPITVRSTRILYLLIKKLLPILKVECEVILSLLTHLLDTNSDSPYWKRILCMEIFQGLFIEFDLLLEIYSEYDQKEGRRSVLKDLLSKMEAICHEEPDVIGVGEVSTMLVMDDSSDYSSNSNTSNNNSKDNSNTNNNNKSNSNSKSTNNNHSNNNPTAIVSSSSTPGISTKTSSLRVSLIDLLDKSDAPSLPNTYLYYLILSCLNSLSEGISKAVLGHSTSSPIISSFINDVWPFLLSSFNIYCHCTIDHELYHNLIRSIQKFTHVTGHLQLILPRDQFLNLLGGMSVVSASLSSTMGTPPKSSNILSVETLVNLGTTSQKRQVTASSSSSSNDYSSTNNNRSTNHYMLSQRNIVCFRALLNLASSLGGSLKGAWNIIFETLMTADYLLNGANNKRRRTIPSIELFNDLTNDHKPLAQAFRRVIESSKDLPISALLDIIKSLIFLSLSILKIAPIEEASDLKLFNIGNIQQADDIFVIDLLKSFCFANAERLSKHPELGVWQIIAKFFLAVITNRQVEGSTRIKSSEILNSLVLHLLIESDDKSNDNNLTTELLSTCYDNVGKMVELCKDSDIANSIELSIHIEIVENVSNLLKNCGNAISDVEDWDLIFSIIDSVFGYLYSGSADSNSTSSTSLQASSISSVPKSRNDRLLKLIKSGFGALQLICSDFLFYLPLECFLKLINTLYRFCYQDQDLNISLTSISFFWTIADRLIEYDEVIAEQKIVDVSPERANINNNLILASDIDEEVDNEKSLLDLTEGSGKRNVYCLWVVCLLKLSSIASTTAQSDVRNGSVQILFRIFDSHFSSRPPNVWKACKLIILPRIMNIKPDITVTVGSTDEFDDANSWVDTIGLILNGLSLVYSNFNSIFICQEDYLRLWNDLIIYYRELIDYHNAHIATVVYSSLTGILTSFVKEKDDSVDRRKREDSGLFGELTMLLWDFWTTQEVPDDQDLVGIDLKALQESLTNLVQIHIPLYCLTPHVDIETTRKSVRLLEKCAAFKLLPNYYTDKDHMSPLQSAALQRLFNINMNSASEEALIINVYKDLVILPFSAKGQSLSSKDGKLPTFISMTHNVLKHLKTIVIKNIRFFDELLVDDTISNLLKGLLMPMEAKFDCPLIPNTDNEQLWQLATGVFLELCTTLIPKLKVKSNEFLEKSNIRQAIVEGCVSILTADLESKLSFNKAYEKFDIDCYEKFIQLITSDVAYIYRSVEFWEELLNNLFMNSLICLDDRNLLRQYKYDDPLEFIRTTSFRSFYGTTKNCQLLPRPDLAYKCMSELFRLSSLPKDEANEVVVEKAVKYTLLRSSLVLTRFVANHPLRGKRPLPMAEKYELRYTLNSLILFSKNSNSNRLEDLFTLLSRSISIATFDPKILGMLSTLMLNLG